MSRPRTSTAWFSLPGLALAGCFFSYNVVDLSTGRLAEVRPGKVTVARWDANTCPDTSCCEQPNPVVGDGTEERCCGRFSFDLRGRDTLTGSRWLPGNGSQLDVLESSFAPVDPSPSVYNPVPVCYQLAPEPIPSCNEDASSPLCETGLPPDDGILRLFFENGDSIDLYVEVAP
jgi:hypothetical protein